jgi:hypothetical protein
LILINTYPDEPIPGVEYHRDQMDYQEDVAWRDDGGSPAGDGDAHSPAAKGRALPSK